jgi:hypothetical protein
VREVLGDIDLDPASLPALERCILAHTTVVSASMSSFKPGHPKYGGRVAGTPNKSDLMLSAQALAEKFPGFHPVAAMKELYNDLATPIDLKVRLLDLIASYTVPRLKPIDPMEIRRLSGEAVIDARAEPEQVNTYILAFLDGKLSASDLAILIGALSLKQKGQGVIDEQAELLRLIKG